MPIRLGLSLLLLLSTLFVAAQNGPNFSTPSLEEREMLHYDKDASAHAVVLYEKGNNYFKVIDGYIRLVKEYHTRIKILDEQGFEHGTVEIPLYHNGNSTEKITEIRAVTHNGSNQYNVLPAEMFDKDYSERWRIKTFTFPNMQQGSILEYAYTLITPYDFNFSGWDFQSSIPKIYTEFNAQIPGNWIYNRTLIGNLKLDVNEADLKKGCFYVEGIRQAADCEVLKYAMHHVPAFKAEEEFMLAEENYRSRLDFELSQYNRIDGTTNRYTKSWKDVDQEFRHDKDIGRQLTKKGFFERNVPESLLTEGDVLTRAQNIYRFVQDHYTWNEKYSSYGEARVKEAFESGQGNAWEINMSLINLLNAADIPSNLMLLSTRQRGLPKKFHPVMSDFNYIVAKTDIGGKTYLLDATNKYMPFGMLPFQALNHYGRVMDFKNDSYWFDILPEQGNRNQIRCLLNFDLEAKRASGIFDAIRHGYEAVSLHQTLAETSESDYLDTLEEAIEGGFEITSYELAEERTNKRQTSQRFEFEIEDFLQGDRVFFNPFFVRFFDANPFQLEERQYPIDFGYPRSYKYQITINIPEGYEVTELPEEKAMVLENNTALLQFRIAEGNNTVGIVFDLALKKSYFAATDYASLKALFKEAVNLQKNTLIGLRQSGAQP